MADCAYIPECDFYHDKLDDMPMTAEFMKMLFCHKKFDICARHLYLSHKDTMKIPSDLMPNETYKAKKLLKNV